MSHPLTRAGDTADVHFGETIADPYRWLENVDSAETAAWVRDQAAHAEQWLAQLPSRAEIREQLTAIWDRETFSAPTRHGANWFQWRNSGLQAQPVLYVGATPDQLDRVLLDPNTLAADGTTAVSDSSLSHDGTLLAWATSEAGSDWMRWRVRQVSSGADVLLEGDSVDIVERAKFGTAVWQPDNAGYYYTTPAAYPPGEDLVEGQAPLQVRFHALGTRDSNDTLVYAAPEEPEWFPSPVATADQRWLAVLISKGTERGNRLLVRPLADRDAPFTVLVPERDVTAIPVGSDAGALFLQTDLDAPRGRVVRVSLADPAREHWDEVIPEDEATLLSVHEFAGGFLCHRLRDAASELLCYDRAGELRGRLAVPPASSVIEVATDLDSFVAHWTTHSFIDPGSVWRQDLAELDQGATLVRRTSLAVDLGELVSEQVFVTSDDGTRVPVFLTRRAEVVADGEVPALLYGYGGFNIAITPTFSPQWALWVQRGGLLAVACLRGGGEYGTAWYDGGRLANKPNVFDDACAVASWLDTSGWSRPARIAITGRSNGGLLAAACLTRRPELFGAVVPEVGVLDLLRFHLFTVGWAWKSDYGDPGVEADFRALMEWSPLHRLLPGRALPPVLITTGDHDDRVVPAHSFKFAAALQSALPPGSGPALLRVDIDAGHGAGKPTAKSIAEKADVLAFLDHTVGGGG